LDLEGLDKAKQDENGVPNFSNGEIQVSHENMKSKKLDFDECLDFLIG
jgi:hypothetical protein